MILSMSDQSFSQNGEDKIVAGCFPGDFVGSLLEIGAWKPEDKSNSRLFINQGWRAVLCEFSPIPVEELVRAYCDTPRVKVVAAAITPSPQHIQQFEITEDALSAPTDADPRTRWKNMREGYHGGFYGRLWVPTVSLQALLEQFFGEQPPDYVSIDTEGNSYALAIALLRMDHRPKVLCVEHDGRDAEIFQVAKPYGYTAVEINQENMVLCR